MTEKLSARRRHWSNHKVVARNWMQRHVAFCYHDENFFCASKGVKFARSKVFAEGGAGGIELAKAVEETFDAPKNFKFTYADDLSIAEKISAVATKIYGSDGVDYLPAAKKQLADIEQCGFGKSPICVAKTQYSLSDDAAKLARPKIFNVTVREVKISAGAGFVVVLMGNIMTMPGTSETPRRRKNRHHARRNYRRFVLTNFFQRNLRRVKKIAPKDVLKFQMKTLRRAVEFIWCGKRA